MSETVDADLFGGYFAGRRVLVTGHTGFKGSWLAHWLLALGAEVHGLALAPETTPSLFDQLGLDSRMDSRIGDIRDPNVVDGVIRDVRPEVVLHLAAQPLVRESYQDPVGTFETNVQGTVHVLDALRRYAPELNPSGGAAAGSPVVCVAVTSDKAYENREVAYGYREDDPLGGHDPYSASKGAAEIIVHSYRRSFFSSPHSPVRLASARAGNVIGGGDWAVDRIVPDCMRALGSGTPVSIRNPLATRPWQHVLEPLSGYLWLAAVLADPARAPRDPASGPAPWAYNFGPWAQANRTVAELVAGVLDAWPGEWTDASTPNAVHEAGLLHLVIDKAVLLLGWEPVLDFAAAVRTTTGWYRQAAAGSDPAELTRVDLARYVSAARTAGVRWASSSR